jgi:DNA-binding phage protein
MSLDKIDAPQLLEDEKNVKIFLNYMLEKNKIYSMHVFERKGIIHTVNKTKLLRHQFYTIIDNDNVLYTLSFNGTNISSYSEGAWIINSANDYESYQDYIGGDNKWDVTELHYTDRVDAESTLANILEKIDSNVKYYYKDHVKNIPGHDNCLTAVRETVMIRNGVTISEK